MKTKAIIFDKDGTLLSFDSFWVKVSVKALSEIFTLLNIKNVEINEVLLAYGVTDGITDIDGVLSKGTYRQMGEILAEILSHHGYNYNIDKLTKLLHEAYDNNAEAGEFIPNTEDLKEYLYKFKEMGIKMAVVTTDNETVTAKCLNKLGIENIFTKIYTDNGIYPTKPAPYCAFDFMKLTETEKDSLLMVGDTETDVKFARNAGIKVICIAKSEKNRNKLLPLADAVVSNYTELFDIIE